MPQVEPIRLRGLKGLFINASLSRRVGNQSLGLIVSIANDYVDGTIEATVTGWDQLTIKHSAASSSITIRLPIQDVTCELSTEPSERYVLKSEPDLVRVLHMWVERIGIRAECLTKLQRNRIYEIVREEGFLPTAFTWAVSPDPMTAFQRYPSTDRLRHNGTGFWFQWQERFASKELSFRDHTDTFPRECPGDALCQSPFRLWLSRVRDLQAMLDQRALAEQPERDAPDLWQVTLTGGDWVGKQRDNAVFTDSDREVVIAGLLEFREVCAEYVAESLNTPQEREVVLTELTKRVGYLEEVARRADCRRIDWKNMFVGQAIQMVFNALLPVEVVKSAMRASWIHLVKIYGENLWLLSG